MKTIGLALFLGTVLSLPILYLLELSSPGAITLVIFLCVGLMGILIAIVGRFKRKG